MFPPTTTLDFVLSGTVLVVATVWRLRTRESPQGRVRSFTAIVGVFGAVALLWFTIRRFGYVDAVLTPSSGFGYGPFWRALPAIAAEILAVSLFSIPLVRGVLTTVDCRLRKRQNR
ncbi:hypothetical protein C453_09043 [Haloferax elongans ATCC BAA-1513]|uniref:Uncharacterized protein n=1 Tax=Haloferax elongans ATCC BAA-1513 TaxID=1230453 RepID=M0HMY8_HALEO|nr:hypothetical protein [Haloferax elongans]ELZ85950.1 hypothetical protein C453_09043 [Haloferax elongans ATCC BAA-1513]